MTPTLRAILTALNHNHRKADMPEPTTALTDGLREQYAALFRSPPGVERLGDATPGEIADAVLAIRDLRMEQLAAGRDTWKAKAEEIERDRDRIEMRAERTARTLRRVRGLLDRTQSGQWVDPLALRFIFDTQDPEPGPADA